MKKAFTLIELLIVIAIIAILAGVVFINLNSARKRARDVEIKNNLSEFSKALEIMKIDIELTTVGWSNVVDTSATTMNSVANWKDIDGRRLVAKLPTHPISSQNYQIRIMSNSSYALLSRLTATDKYWCIRDGSSYEINTTSVTTARNNCAS
jgi:prepilin-type N-terminal cleavage/methylation domain-containing protein